MTIDSSISDLIQANELAHLQAEVALAFPDAYTPQEQAAIADAMESTGAALEGCLRARFDALPPQKQVLMLDLLEITASMPAGWWRETLVGRMPDSPGDLMMQNQRIGILN